MDVTQYAGPAAPAIPASIHIGDNSTSEKANSLNKTFGFQVVNGTGAAQRISFTPSYVPAVGKLITDGAIIANLVSSSTCDHTIAEFLEWIKFHATRVSSLLMTTDTVSQLQQSLTIQKKSLFGNPQAENLLLSAYTSPQFNNDKMVIIERPNWQLDNDTEHSLIIPSGATTTFQFFLGYHVDHSGALRKVGTALNK